MVSFFDLSIGSFISCNRFYDDCVNQLSDANNSNECHSTIKLLSFEVSNLINADVWWWFTTKQRCAHPAVPYTQIENKEVIHTNVKRPNSQSFVHCWNASTQRRWIWYEHASARFISVVNVARNRMNSNRILCVRVCALDMFMPSSHYTKTMKWDRKRDWYGMRRPQIIYYFNINLYLGALCHSVGASVNTVNLNKHKWNETLLSFGFVSELPSVCMSFVCMWNKAKLPINNSTHITFIRWVDQQQQPQYFIHKLNHKNEELIDSECDKIWSSGQVIYVWIYREYLLPVPQHWILSCFSSSFMYSLSAEPFPNPKYQTIAVKSLK